MDIVITEFMKYKRTAIIWMILIGGFFSAGTGFLLVSSHDIPAGWENYTVVSMNCINMLALLLTAVFTGYVIMGEYQESTVRVLFTYPVSKIRIFISKHLVVLVFVMMLYMVFFISAVLFGTVYTGNLPAVEYMLKLLKFSLIMGCMNFILAPLTSVTSLLIKGSGTYLFVGMGYFLTYMSFINSDYSLIVPSCIPNKLIENYFISEFISNVQLTGIVVVSAVTFIAAFVTGAVYYWKSDCLK